MNRSFAHVMCKCVDTARANSNLQNKRRKNGCEFVMTRREKKAANFLMSFTGNQKKGVPVTGDLDGVRGPWVKELGRQMNMRKA